MALGNINPASLVPLLSANIDLRFKTAYGQMESMIDRYAMRTTSRTRTTHYPIKDRIAGLRLWAGARRKKGQQLYNYSLTNQKYEDTLTVAMEDVEDDQYGIYGDEAALLGAEAKVWPDQILTAAVELASVTIGFDLQPFFNASHPIGATATLQSNLFNTANGGTRPFNAANVQFSMTAMNKWKAADGAPIDGGLGRKFAVMVPSALEWTARTVLAATTIAPAVAVGGNAAGVQQTNILVGAMDVIVNPWLTSDTAWYVMKVGLPYKPFIFQERVPPTLQRKDQIQDENVFWDDELIYGVRARGAAGIGPWFLAAKFDV